MEILKQVVGIDVSKAELICCLGTLQTDQNCTFSSVKMFPNTLKGFSDLVQWAEELKSASEMAIVYVMEATGVYYEGLAFYLASQSYDLAVMLPNKVKHYAKSLNQKSKESLKPGLDTLPERDPPAAPSQAFP
ncbi:MAG: transposase [Bacteroidota bacterium]